VSYRFVRSGVYPYVCTYHPGMVGAVVVGDGTGLGAVGTTTAAGPVTLVNPSSELRRAPLDVVTSAAETRLGGDRLAGVGALMVLLFIAGVAWVGVRRHRVSAAES